jgi:hypothetical protein
MSTLDAQSFPHFLIAVVAFASAASLRALRGVSRGVRAAADARLFKHVHIVYDRMPTILVISVQPFGTTYTYEWLRFTCDAEGDLTLIEPGVEPSPDQGGNHGSAMLEDAQATMREYVHQQVLEARVLDVPHPKCKRDGKLLQTVVKYLHAPPGSPQTTRLITPVDVGLDDVGSLQGLRIVPPEAFTVATRTSLGLSRSLSTLPGQLSAGFCCMFCLWSHFAIGLDGHYGLLAVHLLHGKGGRWDVQPLEKRRPLDQPLVVIIVGGAAEIRQMMKLPPTASEDELYAALDAADMCSEGRNLSWGRYIHLVTPQEYLAEVGAEQVALETKVDPYSGPPAVYLP